MTESAADCIFCKIVAGDVPADVLGRNEHAISFKDLHPQAPFHALVVPFDHHENVAASAAADPSIIGHAVALADEVAKAAGFPEYRLIANTGPGAGQSVFHAHLHVLGSSPGMTEALL
jgi:histidine triad (HIT) family protein